MSDKIVVHGIFEFEADAADQKETEWRGMPSFNQPDNGPYKQIIISFKTPEDMKKFTEVTGIPMTDKTKSSWFPFREQNKVSDLFYVDTENDIHSDSDQYQDEDE